MKKILIPTILILLVGFLFVSHPQDNNISYGKYKVVKAPIGLEFSWGSNNCVCKSDGCSPSLWISFRKYCGAGGEMIECYQTDNGRCN